MTFDCPREVARVLLRGSEPTADITPLTKGAAAVAVAVGAAAAVVATA